MTLTPNKHQQESGRIINDLLQEIKRLEAENEAYAPQQEGISQKTAEWISIEERLPEDMRSVLFCTEDVNEPAMIPLQGYYNATTKEWVGYLWSQKRTDVTHWIYTPEPPAIQSAEKELKEGER